MVSLSVPCKAEKSAAVPATEEPGHLENNEILLVRRHFLITSHSSLVDTRQGLKTSTTPQQQNEWEGENKIYYIHSYTATVKHMHSSYCMPAPLHKV